MTSEECHLGAIGKVTFDTCIREANEKQKNMNLNILLKSKIFNEFSKKYFKKYYFNFFVSQRYEIYDKLCVEGSPSENIYIIKNGEFEITIKKSLIELGDYIRQLGGHLKNCESIREMMADSMTFTKFMNEKRLYRVNKS
jgi:CRP-like cAMP-binding protein